MPKFCGQEHCLIDRNGRIRLPARLLDDFLSFDEREVVVHCLPENALAVYPLAVWRQMRADEPRPAARAGGSLAYRRQLRRFGAFTQSERLSNQGRITIPGLFRESLRLMPGETAVVVGCEIGVEVWNLALWQREFAAIRDYENHRSQVELAE